jgi:hypothetical protein
VMRTEHQAPGPATGIEVMGDAAGRFTVVA